MASIFIRDIPREVRDRFRALCVMRGTTMRQAMVELMLKALQGSPISVPELPEGFRGPRPKEKNETAPSLPPEGGLALPDSGK